MVALFERNIMLILLILFVMNKYVSSTVEENQDDVYSNSSQVIKSRMKRYLSFQPGTRVFFRVNVKDNIIKINQIFAHAFGFRANIDLLQPERKHHKIRRREIYDNLEELINQHGFDGRACILKTFCDASKEVTPQSGMLFKLFKMIFTNPRNDEYNNTNSLPKEDGDDYPYLKSDDCDELEQHCPLSLLEMTTYTDV